MSTLSDIAAVSLLDDIAMPCTVWGPCSYLQILDLHDLDHLDLIAREVVPQAS
ncbi:hypothetical protein [Ruania zhangjianzhongii]|uniref:hypothetical protein n=1 Tax=Ruania zhangjianzhongii TaxID=2603206 RepID=UPI00143D77A7|nr:hypothetical protein [Ruania zhangjianzhongii]